MSTTLDTRDTPDILAAPDTRTSRTRPGLVLALLFLATFTLGYSEELVVGVLDLIAADLHVPIPAAGGLVTAYALGLAIGGPVLTALTIRINRKSILLATLVVFLVATLLPLLVENLSLFYLTRAIAGASGGLFIAAALITATTIVPADRTGRALSAVIAGFMVATAFGVPLGTLVGQALGWRGAFAAVLVLALPVTAAIAVAVPDVTGTGGAASQARYAFAPRVLAMLGLMILVFTAISSAFTYIVPFLRDVTGVSGPPVSVFLLAYGAATAVGSFAGGRFADRAAARTVTSATMGLAAGLVALYLVGASAPLVAAALLIWGVFAFGMVPSLQYRIVELAGPGGELAASLPASAANAGIALGAVAGGAALGTFGTPAAVLTALVIATLAIPAALATSRLRPPHAPVS
jgi:MFS transporter, DHA1 family, inner membrane transport protein